jgi:D-alanine-D-alanine ligase
MDRATVKNKKIGVLMGGLSAEREVSLNSGKAVHAALIERGYNAVAIDVGRDIAARLVAEGIEVAFICLHGRLGEDGTIQGLLEVMGIPYTGSGVLASALAMNKTVAKVVFSANGLTVAPYVVLRNSDSFNEAYAGFGFPLVVKPSQEGSSVGVSIVREQEELLPALKEALRYDDEILVEQYIKGREIQVAILAEQALGAIEIVPKREFYDFQAKYTAGMAEHICPAPLEKALYEKVLAQGELAHRVLGCSGYSRVDFLVTEQGDCFLLEVNTLPGMTALSLMPEIAQSAGFGFADLVEEIVSSAALKIKSQGN